MNWWVFAVSGAGMLVLALLILGFQIIRAATVNPVKSLRTE
jgi:ABC-type antimicrobial peptide transport system permease subunit